MISTANVISSLMMISSLHKRSEMLSTGQRNTLAHSSRAVLLLHYICNLWNDPSVQPRLTFADWSVVAPGSKDLSHSLTANGLTALKNIVFSATELHHAADAAHKHTITHSWNAFVVL